MYHWPNIPRLLHPGPCGFGPAVPGGGLPDRLGGVAQGPGAPDRAGDLGRAVPTRCRKAYFRVAQRLRHSQCVGSTGEVDTSGWAMPSVLLGLLGLGRGSGAVN